MADVVIWKIMPPNAGRFLVVSEEEAAELIEKGEAQSGMTDKKELKQPVYKTRDLRADRRLVAEREESPKPKRKRRTKKEMEEAMAAEAAKQAEVPDEAGEGGD
jgi:hypothetical protein